MDQSPNCQSYKHKTHRKHKRINICDFGLVNGFLNTAPQAQATEEK